MSTCAERGVMCEGDLEECQMARRCLLDPGKRPDLTAEEHARATDYGWETV